jgi:hypothetical protein
MNPEPRDHDPQDFPTEDPWMDPSTWYKYHCPSCSFETWIEDIVVDAFPPERPGGLPLFGSCIQCGNEILRPDPTVPPKKSFRQPP